MKKAPKKSTVTKKAAKKTAVRKPQPAKKVAKKAPPAPVRKVVKKAAKPSSKKAAPAKSANKPVSAKPGTPAAKQVAKKAAKKPLPAPLKKSAKPPAVGVHAPSAPHKRIGSHVEKPKAPKAKASGGGTYRNLRKWTLPRIEEVLSGLPANARAQQLIDALRAREATAEKVTPKVKVKATKTERKAALPAPTKKPVASTLAPVSNPKEVLAKLATSGLKPRPLATSVAAVPAAAPVAKPVGGLRPLRPSPTLSRPLGPIHR